MESNLRRNALLTKAGSSTPMLLREGNRVRSICVSPKSFSVNQSETVQHPGKLTITSEGLVVRILSRRKCFSGDLWDLKDWRHAFLMRSSLIPKLSPNLSLAIVFLRNRIPSVEGSEWALQIDEGWYLKETMELIVKLWDCEIMKLPFVSVGFDSEGRGGWTSTLLLTKRFRHWVDWKSWLEALNNLLSSFHGPTK